MENVEKEARRDWKMFQRMGQVYILPVKHYKAPSLCNPAFPKLEIWTQYIKIQLWRYFLSGLFKKCLARPLKGSSFFQKSILLWLLPWIFHSRGNHIHKPHPFQNNNLLCNLPVQELLSYDILLKFTMNNLTNDASSQSLCSPEQMN